MEEVTFEKVKTNGDDQEARTSLPGRHLEGLQTEEDQFAFVEDIQDLLFDDDLLMFNDLVAEEQLEHPDVAVYALRQLTMTRCPPGTRAMIIDELMDLRKTPSMTVREYSRAFRKLNRMITFIDENEAIPEADLVRLYKNGMPIEWQIEVTRLSRTWNFAGLELQFQLIERSEKEREALRSRRRSAHDSNAATKPNNNGGKQQQQQKSDARPGRGQHKGQNKSHHENKFCTYCKRNNHTQQQCFRDPSSPAYRPRNGPPRQQNRPAQEHFAAMQEQINQMSVMMETMKKQHEEELNALRFYEADENNAMNFTSKTCSADTTSLAPLIGTRVPSERIESVPVMEIEVRIGSTPFTALIDTGCSRSAVDQRVVDQVRENLVLHAEEARFKQADTSVGKTTHTATTQLALPLFSTKRVCTHKFRVAPRLLYAVILGKDFFADQGIDLLFSSKELEWDGLRVPMPKQRAPRRKPGLVPYQSKDEPACPVEIAVATDCGDVQLEDMIDKTRLSDSEIHSLVSLLIEFYEVASGKLGKITGDPYELPIPKDATPFVCRPYPVPNVHLAATKQEIHRLVQLDVLSPDNSSPWASPAFIILKKDGSIRLLCDFRRLNALLLRRFFPLLVIAEMLRQFQSCKYISAFDVPMGYYARVLAQRSRAATAIVFPFGKFVFNRLPMGVATAPDEFQAVMNETLGDLDYVWVYLDDFIVMSSSFDEHMEHLREVFRRLRDRGLTIHPKKTKLCTNSVAYLGYKVSTTGVQPLHDKVSAIQAIAAPSTRRQLRRFIGMVNYYRDMWPRRAHILAPLTALTSPQARYQWTDLHQRAFEEMKDVMTQTVELAFPSYGQPFHIFTDASGYQLGAVITQDDRPLAFWSKKCTETQRKYPANRLELLSILLVLREYRTMLLGQEVHIHTDHLNLTYGTFNNIQMLRWRLEIEEFGPRLHYIKGESNVVADALSRLPGVPSKLGKEPDENVTTTIAAATPTADTSMLFSLNLQELARAQSAAPVELGIVKEINGVKLRVHPKNNCILVPVHLQEPIVRAYHEWLMHPGSPAMYQTIRASLYWKGMEKQIYNYVRNCLACTKSKHPTMKYGKLPEKTVVVRPWFEVAIDSIGPYGKQKFRAMTMIDTSTRLVEIQPVDDASSADAAFVFDRFWLCRYPRPVRVIYDQGTEFKKEFFELLDSYGIHAVPTTTRNPQANGVIERLHRVIGDKLRTQTITTPEEWAAFLHDATFALRATHNSMLNSSPAQATFGRDMLFDVEHVTNWDEQYQRKVQQVAKNNTRENAKRRNWTYAPHDKVLLRNDAGPQAKMAPLFSGPYEVVAVRTNGTLVLDKGRYMETVHIRRVVPFKANVGKTVSGANNL